MANNYGLYKLTNSNGDYLGYFVRPKLSKSSSDYIITISKEYEHRPRKLANDLYGEPELYWVFREFNKEKLQDPIFDLVAGISIVIPSKDRLLSYF